MTVLGGVPAPAEGMLTKSYKMTVDGANVGFLALLMPSAPPPAGVAPSECAPPPFFPTTSHRKHAGARQVANESEKARVTCAYITRTPDFQVSNAENSHRPCYIRVGT